MHSFSDDSLVEMARWSIVGRLTASFFHEINNPLQAIRGAASLGLEELDDTNALQSYLELSLHESDRVIDLMARTRRVYRPEVQQPERIDLNHLISEMVTLTEKEMRRKSIRIETQLHQPLSRLTAVFGEMALALLCPILQMSDTIARAGGGTLCLRTTQLDAAVSIEVATTAVPLPENGFWLILCPAIVSDYDGMVTQVEEDTEAIVRIQLPLEESAR